MNARFQSPPRREDARLLRGLARFVDDVPLSRTAEGVFIRSPFAHAEIVSIDTSGALSADASEVLTAQDLPFNERPYAALEASYVFNASTPITYAFSVHACLLELDAATGSFRLLKYFVAHDCGRPINSAIVEGQVVGGVAEGIEGAVLSKVLYDQGGQLLTGSLADYLVSTAPELPPVRVVHRDTRSTTNPLGVRGIGEGGLIPVAAAITNALARAIDPEKSGHEQALFELPLVPERVLAACKPQHAEVG
jgi:CO/xanthine dehydrogenase Mo-binding subunit